MSYDFNTRVTPCDHRQIGERMVVDISDFRTLHLAANPVLNMRAPINGQTLVQVHVAGKLVQANDATYGYDITVDTNRIQTSDIFYKIMFKNAVRWFTPLIEVSYVTLKPYCLKCSGSGQLNDFKKANTGSLMHINGNDKLIQRVLKFVLTSRCAFYPQFTCKLKDYIGKKLLATPADVSSQIIDALTNLKNIQAAQKTIQSLAPQEMLKDVTNVKSAIDPSDPTRMRVSATVSAYGTSTTLPVSFTLTSTRDLVGQ
jgi:hypothetical protein